MQTIGFYWLALLSIVAQVCAADPVVLWSRSLDGLIVVHGRDLTTLDRYRAAPKVTLDGVALTRVTDDTSDGPMAANEVQLFVDTGGSALVFEREDGKTATAKVQRVSYAKAKWTKGEIEVNEPIFVNGGTIEGLSIRASAEFDGPCIICDSASPVRLSRIRVESSGIGIEIRNATDCRFDKLYVRAESPVYAHPQYVAKRNTWTDCEFVGTHPQKGQASNRGILGEETLVANCVWRNIDRGLVAQQSGPPLYANLFYRCTQRNTGTTIGGSEGILFECYNGVPVSGAVNGTKLVISTTQPPDTRVGMFCVNCANGQWGRIAAFAVSASSSGLVYTITLDRDLGVSNGQWFVGNVACQNTIVHQTATSGKLALHLFGRSIGTVCRYWDCRDIHDIVIEETPDADLVRKVYGFAWGNVYDHLRCTGESRGVVRTKMAFDATKPDEQLPWVRYAKVTP